MIWRKKWAGFSLTISRTLNSWRIFRETGGADMPKKAAAMLGEA